MGAYGRLKLRVDYCIVVLSIKGVSCCQVLTPLDHASPALITLAIVTVMATILITGANRGIGFAIAQAVCDSFPTSTVLIGCRDVDLGEQAIKRLRFDGVTASLHTLPLDIESDASIAAAATIVDEKFGKLDNYCVVKAALNMFTVHLQAAEHVANEDNKITFWVANPGHCKTGFNGFRGHKDPLEGAEVVLRLLKSERGDIQEGTFWEFEDGKFRQVPW
ncbi:hypothetical protein CHU98_g7857 [Xylaria longipes]|nr:hypothetical protein CHU98_g7857 [Xylaria longipes]